MKLQVSELGKDMIREFELDQLTVYLCPAGIKTVGVGHTGEDISHLKLGDEITQEESDAFFAKDLERFEKEIGKIKGLDQYQFDALVSFAFNVGCNAFHKSTLRLRVIQDPDNYVGIGNEFARWVYANGIVWKGLKRRRLVEFEFYSRGKHLVEELPMIQASKALDVVLDK